MQTVKKVVTKSAITTINSNPIRTFSSNSCTSKFSKNTKENNNFSSQTSYTKIENEITALLLKNNYNNLNSNLNFSTINIDINNSSMSTKSAFLNDSDRSKSSNDNNKLFKEVLKGSKANGNDSVVPLRRKSQEYAFFQIENVHNYCKFSHIDYEESINANAEHFGSKEGDINDVTMQTQNSVISENGKFSSAQEKECNRNRNVKGVYINCYNNRIESEESDNENGDDYQRAVNNNFCSAPVSDEEKTPDHHARRPMNAFLIFCKRHRAIVREKYKSLENRSITKILGDWWATLNIEEKACYTDLAKQYKDAFFSANPNFKWYKLPAPPLRTLNTRPSNADHISISQNLNYDKLNSNKEFLSFDNKPSTSTSYTEKNENCDTECQFNNGNKKYSNVAIFKLAEETQMGNLSTLIVNNNQQKDTVSNASNSNVAAIYEDNDEIKSVNNIYTSSTSVVNNNVIKTENNFPHKRKSLIYDNYMKESKKMTSNSYVSFMTNIDKRKSTRACKGKKYQELINSGQITPFMKKLKVKASSESSSFAGASNNLLTDFEVNHSPEHFEIFVAPNINGAMDVSCAERTSSDSFKPEVSSLKQFDASHFDLEEKIRALPAQNLENYLQRKRETKKKRKINSKRQNSNCGAKTIKTSTNQQQSNKVIVEKLHSYCSQKTVVGSQKRKARKENIMRRDIDTVPQNNNVQKVGTIELVKSSTYTDIITTQTVKTENSEKSIMFNFVPTDTVIYPLSMLAEVATNHIKEEKT